MIICFDVYGRGAGYLDFEEWVKRRENGLKNHNKMHDRRSNPKRFPLALFIFLKVAGTGKDPEVSLEPDFELLGRNLIPPSMARLVFRTRQSDFCCSFTTMKIAHKMQDFHLFQARILKLSIGMSRQSVYTINLIGRGTFAGRSTDEKYVFDYFIPLFSPAIVSCS